MAIMIDSFMIDSFMIIIEIVLTTPKGEVYFPGSEVKLIVNRTWYACTGCSLASVPGLLRSVRVLIISRRQTEAVGFSIVPQYNSDVYNTVCT